MFIEQIARIIVKQKFKRNHFDEQSFAEAFNNSRSILVLMPEDETDFQCSVDVLSFLDDLKKEIFIVTNDFRVSILPFHYRAKSIGYEIKDINKLKLPSRSMVSKIEKRKYDAVIDLNRQEQLYYSFVTIIANAGLRIGFKKDFADKIYNLQILNDETNAKISYKNLLNCLKML